ncbi:hypothetical protein N7478_006595 [Penicillium angulare]|uniref:uncharacterized protein n=1 Tax=Penicillium angulare TaxID=116970 RepID=UPI002540DF3A|nr:uncharacterized protein N7478_006595 [Penicillium angulare]KAJ5281223.1 hypothetical protein N7478_006595 [Penicillium angulare]
MFSNIVTAAKGLFTRSDSQESSTDPAGTSAAITSEMANSTRQGPAASKDTSEAPKTNGVKKQGKRKAPSDEQQTKRRKQNSLKAAESDGEESESPKIPAAGEKKSADSEPKAHFRFGSEEPETPEIQPEEIPQAPNQDEESDSDSDDAPETIDNSAQLLKIKEQAKKQEKLKKLEEQVKKDKRRRIDERRKLQAKPKAKEAAPSDDLSESTATLQGSSTQDASRSALPALLPDDILNAEPVLRLPSPLADDSSVRTKPNKLRFLDKTEKAPKDVRAGDVTIRVLDAPSVKKNSRPALPPKASKTGLNVKDNWLNRKRSTGYVNGLRRTAGGPSGFVRR